LFLLIPVYWVRDTSETREETKDTTTMSSDYVKTTGTPDPQIHANNVALFEGKENVENTK
jgi:hypothetical protein